MILGVQIRERDLPYLSHELLSGEHELVVDHPSGLVLEQTAVRVNHDCLQRRTIKKKKITRGLEIPAVYTCISPH